jgi:hypothetical protein
MDEDAPSEEAKPPATKADRAAARKRLHPEKWRKQRVSIDACTIGDSCRVAYGRCDLDYLDSWLLAEKSYPHPAEDHPGGPSPLMEGLARCDPVLVLLPFTYFEYLDLSLLEVRATNYSHNYYIRNLLSGDNSTCPSGKLVLVSILKLLVNLGTAENY